MHALILHSGDGQAYAVVVLFPADWDAAKAEKLAAEALDAAKKANPEEWTWEEIEPELEARGFVVPVNHHGPQWD